ncbi:MAG: SUMF1/EgtB/PvdO family nonheme iron enzyme [Deltaproteobacteria bacterium]|nr:SUMF1/EgtB/PvdO family nonheme iron enzyme [Deltaproteobacteria bacterium]
MICYRVVAAAAAFFVSGGSAFAASETVGVPAGEFLMGSEHGAADEAPQRAVALSAFRLDRFEVTNGRYRECVAAGACTPPVLGVSRTRASYFAAPEFADHPVIYVSWPQADAFCRSAGGRLPTEAEWEKAARGASPSRSEYPWGDTPPDCAHANLAGCVGDTDAVGARPLGQSPFAALDMAGNVWEWVADWYAAAYYQTAPATDPTGPGAGTLKVMRGGCWESTASNLRVSCRRPELPKAWADNIGFRCAYDAEVTP